MESNKSDSVAIIAPEGNDRQLMIRLLNSAGYQSQPFPDTHTMLKQSTEFRAMIVCQRGNHALPQMKFPTSSNGQRVVVVSDCVAETCVVSALEQGAHYYFDIAQSPAVLQVRLEAALRQHRLQKRRVLDIAPFKFNLERRSVHRDGKLINLSPKEYEFAYYLFAHRDRVVVNSELMTSVWSLPSTMDARRIDTAACRVRKKMQLGESGSGWSLRRIRRVGYELLWRANAEDIKLTAVEQVAEQAAELTEQPAKTQRKEPIVLEAPAAHVCETA